MLVEPRESALDLLYIPCREQAWISITSDAISFTPTSNVLEAEDRIAGHRLMRRKLGLGPSELGEFHVEIFVEDLAQLDRAFSEVSRRDGPIESLHHAVNRHAVHVQFALYRDFPDAHRVRGHERF